MQRFKRFGWVCLLAGAAAMAGMQATAQSAGTTVTRSKSNVRNNVQSAPTGNTTPDVQENKIKSHSNSTNNREAQTGSQAGVTEESSANMKTKSNIKNDRTKATGVSNDRVETKSDVKK